MSAEIKFIYLLLLCVLIVVVQSQEYLSLTHAACPIRFGRVEAKNTKSGVVRSFQAHNLEMLNPFSECFNNVVIIGAAVRVF